MLTKRIRVHPPSWLSCYRNRYLRPPHCRLSSSTTSGNASHVQSSSASPTAALIADLDGIAPRIDINADQIKILDGPEEFYETLKGKIRGAKRSIYLSTLYIGKSETELISCIRDALLHNGPALRVSILTDALRGTREAPEASCASLLAPLVAEFPDRVEVRMYHTPNLSGLRKALIPKRINEGWGLQHIKLYGIDDEVVLSGANLSNDYFTNRQDRYHVFSSTRVTNYFARIHNTVCSISYLLEPSKLSGGHELVWPKTNKVPDPLLAPKQYITAVTRLLEPFVSPAPRATQPSTQTSVYPLLCFPPTINNELPAIKSLLGRPLQSYIFTAGYFNPHPIVTSSLIACSSSMPPFAASGTVLTASPYANGFFGSKGISGMLPAAYTHLSSQFLRAVRGRSIQLREWQRGVVGESGGWTYHAKGLWVTLPSKSENAVLGDVGPSATLIGSSNYTTRSYGLDLEVGAMVVTSDEALMRKWKREEEKLLKHTKVVTEAELATEERRASWKVKMAMWIVRAVGGAL